MPKAHSRDLRLRVIETIEAGGRNATNSAHFTGALVGGRYAIDFRARRMAMVATGGYCATESGHTPSRGIPSIGAVQFPGFASQMPGMEDAHALFEGHLRTDSRSTAA